MRRRIFIVDDDEMFAAMLHDHLSKKKMLEVFQFATGEEALLRIGENPFIVILDYNLNSVNKIAGNGLVILKEMKKTYPWVHAIMLSSQTAYGVAAVSISAGAVQYVMKDATAFIKIDGIIEAIMKEQRQAP